MYWLTIQIVTVSLHVKFVFIWMEGLWFVT